jgi:hypothetical protein
MSKNTPKTPKIVDVAGLSNVWGLITQREKLVLRSNSMMPAICDGFVAMAAKADWFKSPRGKESDPLHVSFFDNLKLAIVAGFSPDTRALLEADVKVLNGDQKAARRYAQMQIGSRIGDYRAAYEQRITPKTNEPKQNKSDDVFVLERLVAISKRCEKNGDEGFIAIKKLVDQAMKLVPKS